MRILKPIRSAARTVLGTRVTGYVRHYLRRKPNFDAYRTHLTGKRGLEIGGPSDIFQDDGPLPVYRVLENLDNCLFSAQTIWTGQVDTLQGFNYHPKKQPGTQFVCDATDLEPIHDSSYECVLASHCLEHVANPLRALREWRRILKPRGIFLLVLPHKDATFDWRRSTTPLAHLIDDDRKDMGEDDLTHMPEVLSLHDLKKDELAGSAEQFRLRCMNNIVNRAMHHHVFDTSSALSLVDYAAFQVIQIDVFKPFHIVILSRWFDGPPDNGRFLSPRADYRRSSPFASDRLWT